MLALTLLALVLAIPLTSKSSPVHSGSAGLAMGNGGVTISASLLTRIVAIALLFSAILSYNAFPAVFSTDAPVVETLDAGVGLYSGLIHSTTVTQSMEVFLLVSAALILLP